VEEEAERVGLSVGESEGELPAEESVEEGALESAGEPLRLGGCGVEGSEEEEEVEEELYTRSPSASGTDR
jgi:hypothetical protein